MCLHLLLLTNLVIADDRQVIEYLYDQSGNLIEKNTDITRNALPPTIINITPQTARRNVTTSITIEGTGLKNLQISTDSPQLTVTNITSTKSQATFDLLITNIASLGSHTLTLSTLSGEILQNINVLPKLPQMVIRPTPLAIAVNATTEVLFGIGTTDVLDHQITVSIANPEIISASASQFSIIAGGRFPATFLNISGLRIGSTTLTFSSQELGDQVFTVVVGNPFQPEPGQQVNVSSDLLGVELPSNSPDLNILGPITSSLSVFLTPSIEQPTNTVEHFQASTLLGIIKGSSITEITPNAIAANSNTTLTIKGHGLSATTSISIQPTDDITLGELQINPSGTEITVPVSVAPNSPYAIRSVHLQTVNTEIHPVSPEIRQISIGGQAPVIQSIDPVIASRLSTQTLTARGSHFDGDVDIQITPPDDIILGNRITVNNDHTQLSVDLNINESAEIGSRVVTIKTSNGTTTSSRLPTNTLTIANSITDPIPVTSSLLGILNENSSTTSRVISAYSTPLGIVRGTGITAIQPSSSLTDTTVTLTIRGNGLTNVTAVSFEPNEGLTIGAPQISADGTSLTVDVAIAADAPTTTRQLSIISEGSNLSFSNPQLSRFTILGDVPNVAFISPNFIVAGNTSTITIGGKALESVNAVIINPPQGLVVTSPVINTAGTRLTVQVTASSDIQRGARTVIVESASGNSATSASPANQLNIVTAEVLAINNSLVSPLVGVVKGNDGNTGNPTTRNITIVSNLLGINIPKETTTTITRTLYSQQLSVVKGSYITSISPTALQTGITTALTINGAGLQDVTDIELQPADGLSIEQPITINSETTRVTFNVAVAANSEKTQRRIIVHQNDNTDEAIPHVTAASSVVRITGDLPTIESIAPVLQVANSTFELLIRGQNLQEVTAVQAYNANGTLENLITFGTPVINTAGTEIRVIVIVERLVPAGERAIVLTVPVGQTGTTATSDNTLTIDTLSN